MRAGRLLPAGIACLVAAIVLGLVVAGGPPPAVDRETAAWVHAERLDALDTAWRAIALLGGSLALGAVVLAVCAALWRRVDRRPLLFLVASFGGAEVLVWTLKALFDRPRPPRSLHLATVGSPSYPSGHTVVATAVAVAVIVLAVRAHEVPRRRPAIALLALLPVVIGADRVALGVHWVTDVAGGALIGAGWALVCAAVFFGDGTRAPLLTPGGPGRWARRAPAPPPAPRPGRVPPPPRSGRGAPSR